MKRAVSILVGLGVIASTVPVFAASKGETMFNEVCAACHGEKGAGIPGLAPPLNASVFVTATDAAALAAFVLKGRVGKDKKFPNFPSDMPPYGGGKEKAAAIVEYVKGDMQK